MDKENVLIGHIMMDLDIYSITRTLSNEEKASYYDALMTKYRNEKYEQYLINDKVRMCFDFSCMDIDKCKAVGERREAIRKERASKAANARWRKDKKTAEQTDEETAQPSDEIPLAEAEIFEAEQMEEFPFEDFYYIFPMHRDKTIAEKCWSKMPNEKRKLAFEGAKKYAAYIEYRKRHEENVKVMYPSTYLHQKRWEDEYEIPTETNNQNASNYGSNNRQSYKEAEFERNARTAIENLQAAERGELAYLSPFNPPRGQR